MSNKRSAVQPTARENVPKELRKARSSTSDFITEAKSLYYVTFNKDRRGAPDSGAYKNFQSGQQTYQSKCTKFISLLNVVWLFYITNL
jgi:hypothetical protein